MPRRHVDEFYSAYLENTLPDDTRRVVEAHLHTCPRCAAGLEMTRALVDTLHALPAPPVPDALVEGVRVRLRRPVRPLWTRPAWVAAAGLAVALAAAVVTPIWQSHTREQLAQRPTTAPVTPEEAEGTVMDEQGNTTGAATMKSADGVTGAGRTLPAVDNPKPAKYKLTEKVDDPFSKPDGTRGGGGRVVPRPPTPRPDTHKLTTPDRAADPLKPERSGNKSIIVGEVTVTAGAGTAKADGDAATADIRALLQGDQANPGRLRGPQSAAPGDHPEIQAKSAMSARAMEAPNSTTAPPAVSLEALREQPATIQLAWADGKLRLQVVVREAGTLLVTAGGTARNYPVTPPESTITYAAVAGMPVTLTVQVRDASVGFFFYAPAKSPVTAIAADKTPSVLDALRQWAGAAGTPVFCPLSLTQGMATTLTVNPTRPLDALQAFAAQRGATATLVNGVAVLTPKH